ncbi:MAG: SDR family NAD(P)-dependent oxidoreductase, partial [Phycisphaerae bacterium]
LSATRLLQANRPGHLLMTSSSLAHITLPLNGAYSATKAAQHHVCRAMNMELKSRGIRVSSIHPVGTTTEFFDTAAARSAGDRTFARPPQMFMQSPERVANAIVRCLRKPTPEVWTSLTFRLMAALMTIFPRMMDLVAKENRSAASHPSTQQDR